MNTKDYKRLKREVEDRYKKSIEAAEKQKIEELQALETVYRMIHPKRNLSDTNQQGRVLSSKYGSLAIAVNESLRFVPDTFDKNDIKRALNHLSPEIASASKESSITGRLIRLARQGVIKQISSGKGSTSSKFKKLAMDLQDQVKDDNNELPQI
jgi:hypothetical protein